MSRARWIPGGLLMNWIKRWFRSREITWQTVVDDPGERLWKYGRFYLRRYFRDHCLWEAHVEWNTGLQPQARLGVEIGAGDSTNEIQVSIGNPLVRLWLSLRNGWTARICERILPRHTFTYQGSACSYPEARQCEIYWWGDSIHWEWWHSPMEWVSGTPWWRHGHLFILDTILGSNKHEKTIDGPLIPAVASFPDVQVPLSLQRETRIWKRSRWPWWPFTIVHKYVEIKAIGPEYAYYSGKGENSWDCDDDTTMGMSSNSHSYEHAVAEYVEHILKNRKRYGHPTGVTRAIWENKFLPAEDVAFIVPIGSDSLEILEDQ